MKGDYVQLPSIRSEESCKYRNKNKIDLNNASSNLKSEDLSVCLGVNKAMQFPAIEKPEHSIYSRYLFYRRQKTHSKKQQKPSIFQSSQGDKAIPKQHETKSARKYVAEKQGSKESAFIHKGIESEDNFSKKFNPDKTFLPAIQSTRVLLESQDRGSKASKKHVAFSSDTFCQLRQNDAESVRAKTKINSNYVDIVTKANKELESTKNSDVKKVLSIYIPY